MKKQIFPASLVLITVMTIVLSSCIKTSVDPLLPVLGTFSGTITDSDVVSHQVTSYASQPVRLDKLTSSRVSVSSTGGHLRSFYSDVTAASTGFNFNTPGQTMDSINVQGVNLPSLNFPSGYNMVYASGSKQLTFATRVNNPYTGADRITSFTGTQQ